MICSASASSPSENRAVAVTTSGGSFFSVATCAAASAAFSFCRVIRNSPSSMLQLAGSAGLMFTPRRKASMASGACFSATWHCPRSWNRRLNRGCSFSSAGQRRQSGRYVAEHSLGMRAQIEHVSVLGHRGEQGVSSAQGIREPALLNERADSPYFELDRASWIAHGPKSATAGCSSVELVSELHAHDARPQRRLGNDELIGADEHALVRVREVLGEHVDPPGVLGNAARTRRTWCRPGSRTATGRW